MKIPPPSRKRRNICIGVLIAAIAVVILILILAFTVFKPKKPIIKVDSVSLTDLDVALDPLRLHLDFNITLLSEISIKNPNKVGFKYSNSTAFLNYRGELIGEAPILEDKISADKTKHMNITLTMMADRLISKSELIGDVISGAISINTYTRISGKAIILGVFKIHVVSTTSCDITVHISSKSIVDQQCTYENKV